MEFKKILIRKATIIDPTSSHNGLVKDILIEEDVITLIEDDIDVDGVEIFEADNLHVSPGWFDLRANFCDPGHEEKEDIESGINAAIFGGFTGVGLSPDTKPVVDSKASIEYVYRKSEELPVNVYPYGSFSKKQEGKELSEMYDMYQAGAIGFSQGKKPVTNNALLRLAMQYPKAFAPPIHVMPLDENLAHGGQMHEGNQSTYLGLKGIPALSEELTLHNLLNLAEYAETPIHVMGISSQGSVKILEQAQKDGKEFSADVAIANLFFTDQDLDTYDSNLKVLPPIRTSEDRDKLIDALKDGIIQVITSDHSPQDVESKKCEFDHADFGMISLESFFGALGKALDGKLSWDKIIELIAINPRRILDLELPTIEKGKWAEMTFFNPDLKWTLQKEHIQSKSHNSPFIGKELKGKALGIYNEGTMVWLANS
jgi:dihydroorotase